jgi:hypothetical protein
MWHYRQTALKLAPTRLLYAKAEHADPVYVFTSQARLNVWKWGDQRFFYHA